MLRSAVAKADKSDQKKYMVSHQVTLTESWMEMCRPAAPGSLVIRCVARRTVRFLGSWMKIMHVWRLNVSAVTNRGLLYFNNFDKTLLRSSLARAFFCSRRDRCGFFCGRLRQFDWIIFRCRRVSLVCQSWHICGNIVEMVIQTVKFISDADGTYSNIRLNF